MKQAIYQHKLFISSQGFPAWIDKDGYQHPHFINNPTINKADDAIYEANQYGAEIIDKRA